MTPCEELGYKVGDKFEVIVAGHYRFPKGSVIKLERDDGSDCPFFADDDNIGICVQLYIVKPLKSTKEPVMTKSNKYQFHSLSESDIDWNRIAQDLSSKNPLAFVDAGNGEQYVVVHDILVDKAFQCDIKVPEIVDLYDFGNIFTNYRLEESTFNDWVNWAREVKKAKWPVGRKAVVTVSLPKV